tara:strand:- start:110 stop:349 length:240 start_codon:yes stop_codon:yes gene_type:complete
MKTRKQVSIINNNLEVIETEEKPKKYVVIMAESREYKYVTYATSEDEAMRNVDDGIHNGEEEMDTDNCWECISVEVAKK